MIFSLFTTSTRRGGDLITGEAVIGAVTQPSSRRARPGFPSKRNADPAAAGETTLRVREAMLYTRRTSSVEDLHAAALAGWDEVTRGVLCLRGLRLHDYRRCSAFAGRPARCGLAVESRGADWVSENGTAILSHAHAARRHGVRLRRSWGWRSKDRGAGNWQSES